MIPIPDFPDYYACSDGSIFSAKSNKCLKLTPDSEGYLRVTLTNENGKHTARVHNLVAHAYLGPAEGRSVLHGPNGQQDNSVGNLRYGSHMENMADRVRESRGAPLAVDEGYVPLLSEADVYEIRGYAVDGVSHKTIAEWYMIPEGAIEGILYGREEAYRSL